MKQLIYFLALSLILFSCEDIKPKIPQIIISGTIQNTTEDSIKIINENLEFKYALQENGSFSDTIYDFEEGYYKLIVGKEHTNIYLKDNSNLSFSVNAENFDSTIKYIGIDANINNYLAKKALFDSQTNYWHFAKEKDENVFLKRIDSFIDTKNQFLEEYKTILPDFDQNFYELEVLNNNYFGAYLKEMYRSVYIHYTHDNSFEVSEEFLKFRKNIPLENKKAYATSNYKYYINAFVTNSSEKIDTLEKAFAALQVINKNFSNNELKKQFIYDSALQNLGGVKKLDEYWALVSYMVTDKAQFKDLKAIYDKVKKIQPNEPSPLTAFNDKEGNQYQLTDYKGKYVYIDCWAQWCGPCKAEAPFLKKLEEKYANENISFLKLSLDKDKEAWKNYIEKNNATNQSFIVENNFRSQFATAYNIQYIPRFILLDPDLNIIEAYAERPSNPKLQNQLDQLLGLVP